MASLLSLSNELLANIVLLATCLPNLDDGLLATAAVQDGEITYPRAVSRLLRVSSRLRAVTFDQLFKRCQFFLIGCEDLRFLIDYLQRNGVLSDLRHLLLHFFIAHYLDAPNGKESDEGSEENEETRKRKSLLAMAMDVAPLLLELPSSLRTLKFQSCDEKDKGIYGPCCSYLLKALARFQELETLNWFSSLSLVDFDQQCSPSSFKQWRLGSEGGNLVMYQPRSEHMLPSNPAIQSPMPTCKTSLRSLRELCFSATLAVFPHQMAQALSVEQLPSLTSLILLGVRWLYQPKDMSPPGWPLSASCFAGMHPLSKLHWEAGRCGWESGTCGAEAIEPNHHTLPNAEVIRAIQQFHGSTLKTFYVDYHAYPFLGDESAGMHYVDLTRIDWGAFRNELAVLDVFEIKVPKAFPKFYWPKSLHVNSLVRCEALTMFWRREMNACQKEKRR